MKRRICQISLLIMLLFGTPEYCSAQNKLRNSLAKSSNITAQLVKSNLLHAETLFNDSLETALRIIEDNIMLAVMHSFVNEEALGYSILGDFNKNLSSYKLAASYYEKAIKLYDKLNNKPKLANLYLKVGNVHFRLQNNKKALFDYKKAHQLFKKLKFTKKVILSEHKMALVSISDKDYTKAFEYYQSSDVLANSAGLKKLEIESILGMGTVQKLLGKNLLAQLYFKQAEELAIINNHDALANKAYNLNTQLLLEQNKNTEGIQVQQTAYDYNYGRKNSNFLIQNTVNLSQEYVSQGDTKKALKLLNLNEAQVNNSNGNEIEAEVKLDYLKTLAEVYETEGLVEKANIESNKYNALVDSLVKSKIEKGNILQNKTVALKQSENKMLLMEQNRALDERMINVLKLEQKVSLDTIQKQKIINYLLIGGLLVISILAFLLYRSSKQKQKNNQLLVLKSLRSQMNPHFIFNSLNSVNSFIALKDERSANKYLAEFSKLMRQVLECSQEDFISLSKEVEILKLYLNLEHFRFKSHFDFTFTVDEKINLDEYQIPPMLIQPFIENAIWHGLRYKKEKGLLSVTLVQKEKYVEIKIIDNGIGREASKLSKTENQKKMKSTGIKNVENRLELIKNVFKKNLEINIEDLTSENNFGTKVTLKLY